MLRDLLVLMLLTYVGANAQCLSGVGPSTPASNLNWANRRERLEQIQHQRQPRTSDGAAVLQLAKDLIGAVITPRSASGEMPWLTWCPYAKPCECAGTDPLKCEGHDLERQAAFADRPVISSKLSLNGLRDDLHHGPFDDFLMDHIFHSRHYNPVLVSQAKEAATRPHPQVVWNPGSITAKGTWLFFKNSEPCIVVPVWSSAVQPDRRGFLDFDMWKDWRIVVRDSHSDASKCWSTPEHPSPATSATPVVNASAFINRPGRSQDSTLNPSKRADSIALLLGLHIASNEVNNWLWTTTWWQPGDHPVTSNPIANYDCRADISKQSPPSAPARAHATYSGNAIFNPYLEARELPSEGVSGVNTDCISCHSRAPEEQSPHNTLGLIPKHDKQFVFRLSVPSPTPR